MEILSEITNSSNHRKLWWRKKRRDYNVGLIIAGVTAFICYAIVGASFIMPYDQDFEITLFTTAFQGTGYLFMMLFANLFYNLGYWVDTTCNKRNSGSFRQRLFYLGFYFSCALPFCIPLLVLLRYFVEFHKLEIKRHLLYLYEVKNRHKMPFPFPATQILVKTTVATPNQFYLSLIQ